jgi:hypothetical protein
MGHTPHFDGDEPIITAFRDPVDRLLSAFFYYPPHTNVEPDGNHSWPVFHQYVNTSKFQNVITKMLSGTYCYHAMDKGKHTVSKAISRICSTLHWYSLTEMPIASQILLYESPVFQRLFPNPVAFGLPSIWSLLEKQEPENDFVVMEEEKRTKKKSTKYQQVTDDNAKPKRRLAFRENKNEAYTIFRKQTFAQNNGIDLVSKFNQEDIHVYSFILEHFCARLLSIPGLVQSMMAYEIGLDEIQKCHDILPSPAVVGGDETNHYARLLTDMCAGTS